MTKSYPTRSWVDSRLALRPSVLHDRGCFASAPIRFGEVIVIWGGTLMSEDDILAGRAKPNTVALIGEGVYLAGLPEEPWSPDDFMNHSCDPNVWMDDEVTLSARRDVGEGEELTADYVLWGSDGDWSCACDSPLCRGRVTTEDWRLPELQERYEGHFSPFIGRRIEAARDRG